MVLVAIDYSVVDDVVFVVVEFWFGKRVGEGFV